MEIVAMEISTVLLLAAVVLLLRRQRRTTPPSGSVQLTMVEDVARNVESIKQTCLSALAQFDKNLETLGRRTAFAEQQLANLTAAPVGERTDQYQAAALLLAAGHDGNQVASLLELPLVHVEMIRDLRNILARDSKMAGGVESPRPVKSVKRKAVARSGKAKLRPILLTEAVEPAQAVNG